MENLWPVDSAPATSTAAIATTTAPNGEMSMVKIVKNIKNNCQNMPDDFETTMVGKQFYSIILFLVFC